jgi:hypothetical protein
MSSTRSVPGRAPIRHLVGIGVLALVVAGCQSKGNLTGKVTYKGKPLVYGTVLFVCSDNASVQAIIQPDGTYAANGLAVGDARVAVNSPNPKIIGSMANWKDPKKKPPPLEVPGWFEIPARYATDGGGMLTYKVQGGTTVYDIDLQ